MCALNLKGLRLGENYLIDYALQNIFVVDRSDPHHIVGRPYTLIVVNAENGFVISSSISEKLPSRRSLKLDSDSIKGLCP